MSSFDAKINNENMTKCLQSLKEMYQDLRNKGVFCASEAEFQGYNVLLNLNKASGKASCNQEESFQDWWWRHRGHSSVGVSEKAGLSVQPLEPSY